MFYQIEKYLCGYADFDYIDGQEAQLITNKQFATHWRNDKKSWFQQSLAMNKAIQKKGQKVLFSDDQLDIENENFLGTQKAIQYWQYLNLPDAIPEKPNNHSLQFTPGQLFKLLISFSNFLMPQGRIIIQDDDGVPKVLKRELPQVLTSYLALVIYT